MAKDFLLWQIIFKNREEGSRGKTKENTKWKNTLIGKRYICNKMEKQKAQKKYVKHTHSNKFTRDSICWFEQFSFLLQLATLLHILHKSN